VIADVAFDVPIEHPFSYGVPEGWALAPGQRVLAPLRGAPRLGMVVALRPGADGTLKVLSRVVDPTPVLGSEQLEVARWISAESLSSLGSTLAALTPPVLDEGRHPPRIADPSQDTALPSRPSRPSGFACALYVGAGRERRLLDDIARTGAGVLLLAPDTEGCARWAQRLEKIEPTVRLDSGTSDAERARGWRDLATGAARLAVGTRSALLAPLPPEAAIVVLDEHASAYQAPGAPRIHTREVVLERARRLGLSTLLTSATPSAEMWHRGETGEAVMQGAATAPWPAFTMADTRGILRREALTPALAREIREALAAGRRVFLGVSRLASALACDECGHVVRCPSCGIALAYSRAAAALLCRLCGATAPLPDRCPECQGHRLSPFGWGAERVEHAVRRRFPKARIARFDREKSRGAGADAQRAAAAGAEVVIGTRGALRLFGPGALGLAAFVSPDQLLRLPDFRAGEHAFALMWAAAERVHPEGRVVIQSQNPSHYVYDAVSRQDLASFYRHELEFRRELGYPPFRRLAVVTARGASRDASDLLAGEVVAALRGDPTLTVYPPPPAEMKKRARHVVVKGAGDLPGRLRTALREFRPPARRGIMEVEVDPVEWLS
jgi:primosomal protein N' (replication factor Y)